jgi:hypothetical protein
MQFASGFAGFGLVYNDLDELASTAEAELFGLGMRHPGLDLQSPNITSFAALSGIKCVNWLTFVGESLLTNTLPNLNEGSFGEIVVRRQDHGWIVQAGQLLRSIRAKDHPDFILAEDLFLSSPERTNQWLSRFDLE